MTQSMLFLRKNIIYLIFIIVIELWHKELFFVFLVDIFSFHQVYLKSVVIYFFNFRTVFRGDYTLQEIFYFIIIKEFTKGLFMRPLSGDWKTNWVLNNRFSETRILHNLKFDINNSLRFSLNHFQKFIIFTWIEIKVLNR